MSNYGRRIHSLRSLLVMFGFEYQAISHDELRRRLLAGDNRSPLFRNVYWFLQGRNDVDGSKACDWQVVYWITGWEGRTSVDFRRAMCELLQELAHDADCGCPSCYGRMVLCEFQQYRKLRDAGWQGVPDERLGASHASKLLRIHLKLAETETTEQNSRPGEVGSCDSP